MDSVNIKLALKFEHPINAYALVIGGFFPLSIVFSNVLLIDRNILNVLYLVSGHNSRQDSETNKWWINYLNRPECKINPVLCAMEGSKQSPPTYEQFRTAFDEASAYIQEYLPNAQLVSFGQKAYDAAYATIEDAAEKYEREQKFLVACAPFLVHPTSSSELESTEHTLFSLCVEFGLETFSLPFIAALSCLYESHKYDVLLIGRKIIKPSGNYGKKQAHNTLSDLRALEYLALANGLGLGSFAFCTRDKALAAFWCALNFEAAQWKNGKAKLNLSLGETLFPALNIEKINELYQRMVQHTPN